MDRNFRGYIPDRSEGLTHPAPCSGPCDEGNGLWRDRREALRIDHDWIEWPRRLTLREQERLALRYKMLVAPHKHCHDDGKKIASLRGQHIFVPWWPFAVEAPLEQPGLCQMCEPPR